MIFKSSLFKLEERLNSNSQVNGNGTTYVGWNWKAGGAGSANTDGSINSTATSANTTAGISIIKYMGLKFL